MEHISCHGPSGELPCVKFGLPGSQKLLWRRHHPSALSPSLRQLLPSLQVLCEVDKDGQDAGCQKAFLYGITGRMQQQEAT